MSQSNKHIEAYTETLSVVRIDKELKQRVCSTTKLQGDAILADVERTLDDFGIERSPDQKRFHVAFVEACLPHLYGTEWSTAAARVLTERGLRRLEPEVLCITPRRWGKTWSVAMFVAAMLLCVPGIRIAIFSTGKRASSSLTDTIREFLAKLPRFKFARIVKSNQEKLAIAPTAAHTGRPSQLHSFPAVTRGLDRVCWLQCVNSPSQF